MNLISEVGWQVVQEIKQLNFGVIEYLEMILKSFILRRVVGWKTSCCCCNRRFWLSSWIFLDWFYYHRFFVIFVNDKAGNSQGTGINSTYGFKTMMKTCPCIHSTFGIGISVDPSHSHGACVLQRDHFGWSFGVSCHLTMGAPEGPYRWRRVLRTIW